MKNSREMVMLPKIREPRWVLVGVISPVSKQRHSFSKNKNSLTPKHGITSLHTNRYQNNNKKEINKQKGDQKSYVTYLSKKEE